MTNLRGGKVEGSYPFIKVLSTYTAISLEIRPLAALYIPPLQYFFNDNPQFNIEMVYLLI